MKVVCKGHNICTIRKTEYFNGCRHSIPHEHNSITNQSCVDVKEAMCYCLSIKEERKEKLKKLNESSLYKK